MHALVGVEQKRRLRTCYCLPSRRWHGCEQCQVRGISAKCRMGYGQSACTFYERAYTKLGLLPQIAFVLLNQKHPQHSRMLPSQLPQKLCLYTEDKHSILNSEFFSGSLASTLAPCDVSVSQSTTDYNNTHDGIGCGNVPCSSYTQVATRRAKMDWEGKEINGPWDQDMQV